MWNITTGNPVLTTDDNGWKHYATPVNVRCDGVGEIRFTWRAGLKAGRVPSEQAIMADMWDSYTEATDQGTAGPDRDAIIVQMVDECGMTGAAAVKAATVMFEAAVFVERAPGLLRSRMEAASAAELEG